MPTVVSFAGAKPVRVAETQDQVLEAFTKSDGAPFPLELLSGGRVYVNPAAVVSWHTADETISPGRLDPN